MRSLNAHLRHTEHHDGLPFHPSCPICRQTRLVGRLPSDGVVSTRAQAVLAASMLLVSTGVPVTPALAAGEPDQEEQGAAPIADDGGGDPAANPDFDPGGDTTDLPEAALLPAVQAPVDVDDDDAGAVEQEPTVDERETVVDAGDGSEPLTNETGSVLPTQPSPTPTNDSAEPTSPTTTPVAPSEPSAQAPVSTPVVSSERQAKPQAPHAKSQRQTRLRSHDGPPAAMQPAPTSSPAPVRTVIVSGAHAASAPVARAHVPRHPARPGDRWHTVEAGESLWTIATDLLGRDATTAKIAREVHRLWSLNRERIASGDPDLLPVGTTLVLR